MQRRKEDWRKHSQGTESQNLFKRTKDHHLTHFQDKITPTSMKQHMICFTFIEAPFIPQPKSHHIRDVNEPTKNSLRTLHSFYEQNKRLHDMKYRDHDSSFQK